MPVLDGGSGGGGGKKKGSSDGYLSRAEPEDRSFLDQLKRASKTTFGGLLGVLDAPRSAAAKVGQVDVAGKLGLPSQANYLLGPAALPRLIEEEVRPRAPEIARTLGKVSPAVVDPLIGSKGTQTRNEMVVSAAADITQDPLTYVTLGTSAAAKAGLKAIGKELGKETAEQVTKKGAGVLGREGRERVARSLVDAGRTEKQADRILGAVDRGGQGGVKVAGRTVVPTSAIPGAAKTGPFLRASLQTGRLGRASRAITPRAEIAADLGSDAASEIGVASARRRAAEAVASEKMADRLATAVKMAKATRRELEDIVAPAADVGGEAIEVPARLRPVVDTIKDIRASTTQRLMDEGLLDESLDPSSYMPLGVTKRGQEALATTRGAAVGERFGTRAKASGVAGSQAGHLLERTIMPGRPLKEVEEQLGTALREAGVLKGRFTADPVAEFAQRFAAAERALSYKRMVDDIEQVVMADGERLLVRVGDNVAKPAGWVDADLGPFGKFYAPKSIEREINQVRALTVNDESLRELDNLLWKANGLWKGWATAGSVIAGGGFFSRNGQGNVILNWLGGVKNPADYGRSFNILNRVRRGGTESLSAADRKMYDLAQSEGVLNTGFSATELMRPSVTGRETFGRLARAATPETRRGYVGKVAREVNPLSRENVAIRAGSGINTALENHARLTHFIAKMRELGDSKAAAESVREFLFDYGDLTALDQRVKHVVAFWTFMRKNTALQMRMLARQPGKYTALAHTQIAAASQAKPGDYPAWAVEEGMIPVGDTLMVGLDTTAGAAYESVQPSPGNLLGMTGGFVPSVAKALAEEQTGRSLFTGYEVKGSFPKRLAESAFPAIGRVERAPYTAYATDDPQLKGRLLGAGGLQARVLTGDEGPRGGGGGSAATQAPRRRGGGRVLPP